MRLFGFGKKKEEKPAGKKAETKSEVKENKPEALKEKAPTKEIKQAVKEAPKAPKKDTVKKTAKKPEKEIKKLSWKERLKQGLGKSQARLNDGFKEIFIRKKLDEQALEELEELLISSDLGVSMSAQIIAKLAEHKFDPNNAEENVRTVLAEEIAKVLSPYTKTLTISQQAPHVILFSGVNGTGKTTTIGKLAHRFKSEGKSVLITACDTFRAAAVEQLERWAERADVAIEKGPENADPASVAYKAIERAQKENIDVVMIDTAGRLQNKANLMEQLAKVVRVIQKLIPEAPHESIIVLDATTGQNAHSQVKTFHEMVALTGVIITKLDGTAKGGIVVSLAESFKLPFYAIGVGEQIDDLQSFDANEFAKDLVG